MHVCFVSLFYSGDAGSRASAPLMRELPAAMAARGHEVSVLHLAERDACVRTKRATHHYVRPRRALHQAAVLASAVTGRQAPHFEWPRGLPRLLRSIDPDVVHVHGTQQHLGLARVRRALSPRMRLVVHYHGGTPSRRFAFRSLQRRNLQRADTVLFTTHAQADEFLAADMLADRDRCALLVETSSDFRRSDRRAARAETGMHGRPVYLSAARLHPVKDPMTMLRGFECIVSDQPEAELYLFYLSEELLPDLRAFVEDRPALRGAVHFRGRAERRSMEAIFNSADILLQASRREFSGCAVLDAMACGVVPVVSDLPSLRVIAGNVGRYFSVGDAHVLASRALDVRPDELDALSTAARGRFELELSFAAMARKLEAVYAAISDAPSPAAAP